MSEPGVTVGSEWWQTPYDETTFMRAQWRARVWALVTLIVWLSFCAAAWLRAFGRLPAPGWLYAWAGLAVLVTLLAPRGSR